jgi:hypothetical protein
MMAMRNRAALGLATVILCAGTPAMAEDCLRDIPVGVAAVPTQGVGVAVADGYAYVCDTGTGLRVFDLADETNPVEVGSLVTPGLANDIFIEGTTAYIADFFNGIQIVDISDPASPALLGSFNTPDRALGVSVYDGVAYVADNREGVLVIDVADPAQPVLVTTIDTPGRALGLKAGDNFGQGVLVIADGTAGVQVYDITDPAAPTLTRTINTPGNATAVDFLTPDIIYVADDFGGLVIIDNFLSGEIFGTVETPQPAVDVRVSADHPLNTFVAMRGGGVSVIATEIECGGARPAQGEGKGGECFLTGEPGIVGTYTGTLLPEAMFLDSANFRLYAAAAGDGLHIIDYELCFNCPADFNLDGQANILDVVGFINNWNAQGPGSDFNGDGNLNILDVVAFISIWQEGCK